MKLQLKKKNMKTLIDNKAISSNMTPQVAGGGDRKTITTGSEKPTVTLGCSMVTDCQMTNDDLYCKML